MTKINYSIPTEVGNLRSEVRLVVFDVLGREIETIVDRKQKPGHYEVDFVGDDLSSGIYFYRLQADEFIETKKMILLR